jgi:hypothetical protein
VRDACSQKVSKNPKIVCAQVTLTKTGLSAVRTFSPLGVNPKKCLDPEIGRLLFGHLSKKEVIEVKFFCLFK